MEETVKLLEEPLDLEPELRGPVLVVPPKPGGRVRLSAKVRMALALLLSVAAVFCKIAYPEGAQELRRWVVGDGSERVQQAFFRLEEALGEGERAAEAWTVFCQELTDETT